MATSVEEIARADAEEQAALGYHLGQKALVDYRRATAIYFTPMWESWCEVLKEELQARTDLLIDSVDEAEKARLQGMCHTLRWILKQRSEAEANIRSLEMNASPAAGDNGRGAADL